MIERKKQLLLTLGLLFNLMVLTSYNSIAQNTSETETVLAVIKTSKDGHQTDKKKRIFHIDKRIRIRCYSDKKAIEGKLISIGDSTIRIYSPDASLSTGGFSSSVRIKDIKTISWAGGKNIMEIGIGVMGVSVLALVYSIKEPTEEDKWLRKLAGYVGVAGFIGGIPVTIFGFIEFAFTKHYNMDKGFQIEVKEVKMKK